MQKGFNPCISGPGESCLMKKTRVRKSHDKVPLNILSTKHWVNKVFNKKNKMGTMSLQMTTSDELENKTPDDNTPDENTPDDNTPDDNTPDDNTPDDSTPNDNTQ
jgi:hypothetical protein